MLKGFTLIELLAAVIVFGILATVAVQGLTSMQQKAKAASVKANMRATQIAAESFAADNGGSYPATQPDGSNAFSTYYPGGDSGGTKAGSPPVNPFINKAQWTDFISISVTDVGAERVKSPSAATIAGNAQGQIGYVGIGASATGTNFVSYAIEGVDAAKNALSGSGPGTTLVLSNR